MSLFKRLFKRETKSSVDTWTPSVADSAAAMEDAPEVEASFWDSEDDAEAIEPVVDLAVQSRRRRNTTRILGFEGIEEEDEDPFDQVASTENQATMQFPTGWLTVVEGDGRGHSFCLASGLNQIGRGEENSIQLDFGDNSISRQNHFSIVYDEGERKFMIGHGGKSNVVRLNDKPVLTTEDMKDGDLIKVGTTVLMVKTLCGQDFDWNENGSEGLEDVAIA